MKKNILITIIILTLIVSGLSFFCAQKNALAQGPLIAKRAGGSSGTEDSESKTDSTTKKSNFEWEVDYPFEGPRSEQIPDYVEYIYRIAFFVGAALAVLMIIIGGIQWSTAGVNPSAKNEAKDKLTKSIMGVLLLIGSYALLRTINPDLVVIKEPVLEDEKEAELGADTVKTVRGEALCEGNSSIKKIADIEAKGNLPLCGDYCSYYCTGKYNNTMKFPQDYFKSERSSLGLEDDFGYMVGHDPGSGTDVVWCGCYAEPEAFEKKKREEVGALLKKYGKYEFKELDKIYQAYIMDKYEFQHLGNTVGENLCEFFDSKHDNCRIRCGNACFHECRRWAWNNGYGGLADKGRILGVVASSNSGESEDLTWCSCFQTPSEDATNKREDGTEEKIDFRFNEVVTYGYSSDKCTNGENCCPDDKYEYCSHNECREMPSGQPCEGAGEGYPRCGNYCYDFCKEKKFKFGVASAGNWGSGTDEVYCTCFK